MDCAARALMAAAGQLGINLSFAEAAEAVELEAGRGGSLSDGATWMAQKYGLEIEEFPRHADLNWRGDEDASRAYPIANEIPLMRAYVGRLRSGWVGVSIIRWPNSDEFHAIALVGADPKQPGDWLNGRGTIHVACNMRGRYTVGRELFTSHIGKLQAALGTWWMRKKETACA